MTKCLPALYRFPAQSSLEYGIPPSFLIDIGRTANFGRPFTDLFSFIVFFSN
jgi:hypothetical protein